MRRSMIRKTIFGLVGLTLSGSPARAQDVTCTWSDPCASTWLDCMFGFCFCRDLWWTAANWSCNSIPDASNEIAVIQETNRNQMCPEDPTESWLMIHVDTRTFKKLEIKANGSPGLRLAFFEFGAQTLTVNTTVRIDGVNGPVTFEVGGNAKVKTQ